MKIAFLLPQNVTGGGVICVYQRAKHLQQQGNEVLIIYREYQSGRDKNLIEGFGLKFICYDDVDPAAYSFDVIFGTWWSTLYDITYFTSLHYFYFVQSDERRFYENKNDPDITLCEITYQLPAIGIISVAGWVKTFIADLNGRACKVAPCGYDPLIFNTSKRIEPATQKLRVMVEGEGSIWFRRLGDCFEALKDLPGIEVWFVSREGYVEPQWKYDKMFVKLSPDEMSDVYQSCDVLLKMSEVESFCLPNLEMMACGGTIITTDFTGQEEYAVNNYNAIVVPVRGVWQAREALIKLRDDRFLLKTLQKNALDTAVNMTWEKSNVTFEKALYELIDEEKENKKNVQATYNLLRNLRAIKLLYETEKGGHERLKERFDFLFHQHHRKEYRLLRFIGRYIYKIPIIGYLTRKLFN